MKDITTGNVVLITLLTIGVVARLARLVTADSITAPFRKWIERKMVKAGGKGLWNKLDDLINCPWCVSVWIGVPSGVIMVWHYTNRFVLAGAIGLTASWIAANVQVREPDEEETVRIIVADEEDSST